MKLKDVMSKDPVVIHMEKSLKEAVALFIQKEVDGAPVVDDEGQLVGLITKSHVYRAVVEDMDMSVPVKQVMQTNLTIGHMDDSLEEVLHPGIGRLPVVDDEGQVVGMITRTDLARVFFQSYKEVASEFDTIVNHIHNLIISVDEHGKIRVFNRAAEKHLGIKAEEVRGKYVSEVFPTSRLNEVLETGKVETVQRVNVRGRNYISNRTPIYKDGKIAGAVAVLQDVSEFEEMSKEIKLAKELNEELEAIIESSYDGLYVTDGNGITLRLNKAFEMIMGVNGKEFLGKHVEEIEKEGIVSQSVSRLVLQKREPVTIIQESRSGKTVLSTGTPVFDSKGNIFRVVSNIRDLSELNQLKHKLEQAQGLTQHYQSQLRTLRTQFMGESNFIVKSAKMRDLLDMVIRVAQADSIVLITGESGTGKELIASIIHNNSQRKDKQFIKINCGAIPATLLESELFGYEAGAFTGAKKSGKSGYFELADGGTLFLDEIGDLPYNLQVKLLRVLQNHEFNRVGGEKSVKVDVRVIAATNQNLLEKVRSKEFREDLYYRLNAIPVHIPPLRERKEEIPVLVMHFLEVFNRKYKLNRRITPQVIDVFMDYDWPGNIRELENLIERLVVTSNNDIIKAEDLPHVMNKAALPSAAVSVTSIVPMRDAIASVEKQLLQKAFAQYRSTREIGRALQINASTVVRKAARYGIKT